MGGKNTIHLTLLLSCDILLKKAQKGVPHWNTLPVYNGRQNSTIILFPTEALRDNKSNEMHCKVREVMEVSDRVARIMLVEDDALIQSLITSYLEKKGHSVRAYDNSEDALNSFLANDHIDVLFTDVQLPGKLNGVQLATRILELKSDIGVVFMSGYPDPKVFDAEIVNVKSAFLQKPFELQSLDEKIDVALRVRQI